MRILAIGDVIGRPGREAVKKLLPGLRVEYSIDFVIANAENSAGGLGVTPETAQELVLGGVDVLTSGNHIWNHKEIVPHLDNSLPIIRPLNFPPGVPGRGYMQKGDVLVVNLLGRTFIGHFDCPFQAMDKLLAGIGGGCRTIIVDLHAEATAEKGAMGWYLDGRVSAVVGTHTHVGTVDSRILPGGTAFITDIGMVGPEESVIGDETESVIDRFLKKMPRRISVGRGNTIFNSVLMDIDDETGKARSITRLDRLLTGN
ncbi:MAG: TIGR00282 family metallophosphoesterase [Dehalococcoidia bacterium]|nr:TIGR00282 family metallophosphoesterase [Dehalococcoidia bacterium]MDZ4246825.1 TIGR00282 family metallophosphoesterase [Dehalococcoidia bacterium]